MTIEDDTIFLGRVPSFAVLGGDALRILAIGAESRPVRSGEVLFRSGESADAAYVVQEGAFALRPDAGGTNAPERKVSEVLATAGALLGEFALLTETIRPVTAVATEPSIVIRIPRSLFLKMLEGYPDAAQRLRDHFARRAEQTASDIFTVRKILDSGPG